MNDLGIDELIGVLSVKKVKKLILGNLLIDLNIPFNKISE